MQVKYWFVFSLVPLLLVGYTSRTIAQQTTGSMSFRLAMQLRQAEIAQTMTSTKPVIVRSGNFASGEHPTQGTVRIVMQNGQSFLELDRNFKTSNLGPDLVVILHRSSNVLGSTKPPAYPLKAGDYMLLASLRKFSGAQRYPIPPTINLANYQSVAVWCRKFNATFGAARLSNQ